MPSTHTADFSSAALKAIDLEAVEKVNVGLETDLVRKHVNVVADAPEIRIQDKTGSAPEVNQTTLAIVADGGVAHFRAGTTTFAEGGVETKGDVKFQSSTGDTTHAHLVGSSGKLELQDGGLGLKLGSNVSVSGGSTVVQEITGPHARESAVLKKYPEVPLASNVQSGYVIEASSEHSSGTYPGWNAFNGVVETTNGADGEWISGADKYNTSATNGAYLAHSSNAVLFQGARGEYLGIVLPHRIKVKYVSVYGRPDSGSPRTVREYRLWGSNDGSTWNQLQTGTNTLAVPASTNKFNITVDATTAYSRYRLQALSMNTGEGGVSIGELEYYGYEETDTTGDSSVDVTFKCAYNTPDLTNASLYIDAKETGSSVTDLSGSGLSVSANQVTYDSTEKAWVLSGAATSNIVTGDLGFEGDQPHSISAWVKADQLGDDVPLFHLGTPTATADTATVLKFINDSQISWGGRDHFFSNAEWHNVTYVYNSEYSNKKLYIDGKLVETEGIANSSRSHPPFEFSLNHQGGYEVGTSTELSNYPGYKAFNGTLIHASSDNAWISAAGKYNISTGLPVAPATETTVDGSTVSGEWIQLQFPYRLIVDGVSLAPQSDTEAQRPPKDFTIAGSNDGETWETMFSTTGVTGWVDYEYKEFTVNTNVGKPYKIVRIIVERNQGYGSSNGQYTSLAGIQFHARRENDIVRFPDSSKTLSYPRTKLHGPASRGHVVSSSSHRKNSDSTYDYRAYRTFNGLFNTYYYSGWNMDTSLTTYAGSNYAYNGSANLGTGAVNGEWIKIELPRKILMTSMRLYSRFDDPNRAPEDFKVYGSNDDSNWTEVLSETGATPSATGTVYTADTATTYYKYFALVVTRNTNQSGYVTIDGIEYIGTEEAQAGGIVARIGDGFKGKLRNLRVYSTALTDDRVQEIFDADKDEFVTAKSLVSVYRGHLGIGTSTPSGALTVMDEIGELEAFPPRAMYDNETYFEGHGLYRTSSAWTRDSNYEPYAVFNNFTYDINYNSLQWRMFWSSVNAFTSDGTVAPFTGDKEQNLGGYTGVSLKLELPYRILCKKIEMWPRDPYWEPGYTQNPRDFKFIASNDQEIWDLLHEETDFADNGAAAHFFTVNTTKSYRYFGFVTTKVGNSTLVSIASLRYHGVRERGASTLHNGDLTLTRNLNVPRIGPSLDSEDDLTPRRESLIVEYNTSTNPVENLTVKDTSSRGNHGSIKKEAHYDTEMKAFYFDGSNDVIKGRLPENFFGVSVSYTISMWVQPDTIQSGYVAAFAMGLEANDRSVGLFFDSGVIKHLAYGDNLASSTSISVGNWTHVVCTYVKGDRRTYANGVQVAQDTYADLRLSSKHRAEFNLPANAGESQHFDGWISNFKLYEVALNKDEVLRLYRAGRCDDGGHVVNFSKTRVGVGLGDGEAPRSALDVRDKIYAASSTVQTFTGQHKCVPSEPMEQGLIVSASENKYIKLNGGLVTGSKAITIDESLPIVSLSNVALDKKCFGVVSTVEEANTVVRSETAGGIVSDAPKVLGDNRAVVNSVGEGAIWVCDAGGPLDSGDYITTSNVAGYGQKQESEFLANYTVAKITMDCDFTAANAAVQVIKKEVTGLRTITEDVWNTLVDYDRDRTTETQYSNTLTVEAWSNLAPSGYTASTVTTTVDYTDGSNIVSIAEWSNLAPSDQELYTANTHTEITDYTKFITADEWSNLAPDVQGTFSETEVVTYFRKERGANVLDERGNLIWEEKTGEFEPPYKLRFLDATGAQTDEANAVHRAAFVGCTYHCG